jgi:hypothetical protein
MTLQPKKINFKLKQIVIESLISLRLCMVADLCHFVYQISLFSVGTGRKVQILTTNTAGARSENRLFSGGAERNIEHFKNNLARCKHANKRPINNKYFDSRPRRITIKISTFRPGPR